MIRNVISSDIEKIIFVHNSAFPDSFMTRLGGKFLELYYTTVLHYSNSIFLVSINKEDTIDGFVCGFWEPKLFYKNLYRDKMEILKMAVAFIICKKNFWGVVKRFLYVKKKKNNKENDIELASLAVRNDKQRMGLGSSLVSKFIFESKRKYNAKVIHLTTDANDNDNANLFYIKMGFVLGDIKYLNDRLMNEYYYYL